MSGGRMFWKGVWGYLPANIAQGVVGFLAIMVFTRLLTPEDFGRYAIAFSVMTLAHVAVFSWLEASMARFWAAQASPREIAAHFAGLYRTAFILMAAFLPVVAGIVWLLPLHLSLKFAIAAGLFGCPVRCLGKLAQERIRAAGEVRRAAGLDIYVAIAGFGFGVVFAVLGAGAASPLLGLLLAPLTALPFILPGEIRQAKDGVLDRVRLRTYAAYGYPIAASLALSLVLASTDRFLLEIFKGEAAVGAYHAGYSIANRTLDVLFIWLGAAGVPALVMALERGGREALQHAAREQISTFILIALPAAAGVALVAHPLADFLIGEHLRSASAAVTPWVALAALLSGLTVYYFNQAFTLGQRTRMMFVTMAIPALANVALNLALIPHHGVQGAAWATAASFGVGLVASIVLGRRVLVMPIPWDALARCGLACLAMAAVVHLLPAPGGFVELIVKAGVGAVVYGLAAFALNAAGVRDVARRLIAGRRDGALA